MRRRSLAVLILSICVAVAALVGAGPANAAPRELPRLAITGDNFGTYGDHDYCRGALGTSLTSPKPGVLRVTLRSFGFTGNGKGWARNPHCTVLIGYTYTSVRNLRGELWDRVTFAARPGQRVTRDIPTGSGLVALVIGTYSVNSPVRAMQGPGVSFYPIVP